MSSPNIPFDQGPLFPECADREPSLRQLVHKYYESHFPVAQANEYAMRYIRIAEQPPVKPTFSSSVARRKWENLMDEGYRMSVLSFARSLNGVDQKGTIDAWGKVFWEPTPCGCRQGECESKQIVQCRMAEEVTRANDGGLPAPLPLPPLSGARNFGMGRAAYYDEMYVAAYAVAYADMSMRALLGIKAPVAIPVVCSYDNWKPERTIA